MGRFLKNLKALVDKNTVEYGNTSFEAVVNLTTSLDLVRDLDA